MYIRDANKREIKQLVKYAYFFFLLADCSFVIVRHFRRLFFFLSIIILLFHRYNWMRVFLFVGFIVVLIRRHSDGNTSESHIDLSILTYYYQHFDVPSIFLFIFFFWLQEIAIYENVNLQPNIPYRKWSISN